LKRVVGTVFAVSVLTSSVYASAEPKTAERRKSRTAIHASDLLLLGVADSNGDGRVSSAELERFVDGHVVRQVRQRFARIDRDGDGVVKRSDVPRMDAARFARFDLDGDQTFTLVELTRVMQDGARRRCEVVLAQLDVDGDGTLSARDLTDTSEQVTTKLELSANHGEPQPGARK
jgi:Ca2+-binding EF-hand superfamily protein